MFVQFTLKFFFRQIAELQTHAYAAADLFHCQSSGVAFVETLADTAAKQEAQPRQVVVSMDASPAASLEVVQTQLFFADAKFGFDRPPSKGNAQQSTQRDFVFSDDASGDEKFRFPRADAARNNQCVTNTRQMIAGLTPNGQVFDFPDFRPFVSVFDAIVLPRLKIELQRVFQQILNLAGCPTSGHSGRFLWTTDASRLCATLADSGFVNQPDGFGMGMVSNDDLLVPLF